MKNNISPAHGKLGVLVVGINGAVATTFIAGLFAIKKGYGKPFGSLTQLGTIRLGKRSDMNFPKINEFVPLADINDIVIGGWDIFDQNLYDAASESKVLEQKDIDPIKQELQSLRPMRAVFDNYYVKKLNGTYIKSAATKMELAEQLRADIRDFKSKNSVDRLVMIWCGSTEIYMGRNDVHNTIENFEKALQENDVNITPSMLYAYAAIMEGVPYANGAPNLTVDIPALIELSKHKNVPIAGKDFKTGQTLIKTVIAPMLKARMLGLQGWFSTNILGNRDGEVLDDPFSFKTKEESKLSVLEQILQPDLYPELYKNFYHKVRINYYPPRGDSKEGWDNIDIFGWLGYPMQIKVDFLCRDSILAAPIVLDLVLFIDLAQRVGMNGIQEWLSFYFKSPMHAPEVYPEHDLFIQQSKLKNTLRHIMGEDLITHLGLEYYEE